jgi:hypothetical protein
VKALKWLIGDEYEEIVEEAGKTSRWNFDDVPVGLRASEKEVLGGGQNNRKFKDGIPWYGCPVAAWTPIGNYTFRWFRCPHKPRENGYCGQHRLRAK